MKKTVFLASTAILSVAISAQAISFNSNLNVTPTIPISGLVTSTVGSQDQLDIIPIEPEEEDDTNQDIFVMPVVPITNTPSIIPLEPEESTDESGDDTGSSAEPIPLPDIDQPSNPELDDELSWQQFELNHTLDFISPNTDSGSENQPTVEIHFSNELDDALIKKIKQSDTNPGEIINPVASKMGKVLVTVEEEADDKISYKLKPIVSAVSFGDVATSTGQEIVSISGDKYADFKLKEKSFAIDKTSKFDYSDLTKEGADYFIGLDIKTSAESKSSHLQAKPAGDCLELYLDVEKNKKIDLCSDLSIEPEAAYLTDGDKKFQLSTQPDLIFDSADEAAKNEGASIVSGKLQIENDQPIYNFSIEEKHKFLWLIPVKLRADLKINASDNSVGNPQYNWLGAFFKDKSYIIDFQFGPNLVVVGVNVSPQSLHTGDKETFEVTIKNIGNQRAYNSYGNTAIDLRPLETIVVDSSDYNYSLDPDETKTYHLYWNAIICNVPFKIVIDPDNKIEELDENDNTWSGTVKCAPTDAPDLIVESVIFDNNTKRVGVPNNVKFTIKNNGTQPAPEFTSFYRWDGLSSSILVPPLAPGATWSTTRTITPQSCGGVKLELDTSNIVNEINEDNNSSFESGDIILACSKRPDLFVDSVWWTANGYTAGDIHAGEEMWFQYKVKNDPQTFTTNDACLQGFKVVLKLNGQTIKTENLGWIGCVPNYGYNHPDYWTRLGHFTYTPQCNGEHLTIEIDPNNTISEGRENNNTWTMDIVCTLPPPVSTPTP